MQSVVMDLSDDVFNQYLQMALDHNKTKLNLTAKETEQFTQAMKRPDFTKLMKEYMEEISDPKNRAEQEAYLARLEQENRVPENMKLIRPKPAFCVKTKRMEQSVEGTGAFDVTAKLFINICTAIEIALPQSNKSDGGFTWNIPYSLGPLRYEQDKAGQPQTTFDFAVHPSAVQRASESVPFHKMLVDIALDAVESRCIEVLRHPVKLDKKLARVLKGLACIGETPAVMNVPQQQPPPPPKDTKTNTTNPISTNPKQEQKSLIEQLPDKTTIVDDDAKVVVPKYRIIHRGNVELSNYVNQPNKIRSNRPKELVIRIQVPKITSAKYLDVETSELVIKLKSTDKAPVQYAVEIDLPYSVDDENGHASFDKAKQTLEIVLPVVVLQNHEMNESSKLDVNVLEEESVLQEEEMIKVQTPMMKENKDTVSCSSVATNHSNITTNVNQDPELDIILRQALEASKLPLPVASSSSSSSSSSMISIENDKKTTNNDDENKNDNDDSQSYIHTSIFSGAKSGYVFKTGDFGTGYYRDHVDLQSTSSIHNNPPPPPPLAPTTTTTTTTSSSSSNSSIQTLQLQNREIYELD